MKILLADQFSGGAGGQRCLLDLAPALVERGWTVQAVIPSGGTLSARLAELGIDVIEFPPLRYTNGSKTARDAVQFAWDTARLAQLIRRQRADVVYANGPRVLPAAWLGAGKLVFHAHILVSGGMERLLVNAVLQRATVIAACRFVSQPLPKRRLRVVYSGVEDHGASNSCFRPRRRIGLIGRISREKGQLDFLRAARLVLQKTTDCEFVICGAPLHSADAAYVKEVGRLAKDIPATFLGWTEDVGTVLGGLTALAVPSSEIDAAPRVIPEAFSAGVPVVAYPSGGIVELIDHGVNGLLTAAPRPEALADGLLSVLNDPSKRKRMSECARACYLKRFTVERYRREVVEILERV